MHNQKFYLYFIAVLSLFGIATPSYSANNLVSRTLLLQKHNDQINTVSQLEGKRDTNSKYLALENKGLWEDIKEGAANVGEDAAEVGEDIGEGAEEVGEDALDTGEEVGEDIGEGAEEAGEDIGEEAEEVEEDITE